MLILKFIYCGQVDLEANDILEFQKVAKSLLIEVDEQQFSEQNLTTINTTEMLSHNALTPMSSTTMHCSEISYEDDEELYEESSVINSIGDLTMYSQENISISSVRTMNSDPVPLRNSTMKSSGSKSLMQPPTKKPKIKVEQIKTEASRNSKVVRASDGLNCKYCDRKLRFKDQNYHQRYCWKNPNRIVSDCEVCNKKFEVPSTLKLHMQKCRKKM
jgi:hypothetical protein